MSDSTRGDPPRAPLGDSRRPTDSADAELESTFGDSLPTIDGGAVLGTLAGACIPDLGALGAATASSDFPTLPGLEIVGELGRGGMGVVYRAREPALDREVAAKSVRFAEANAAFAAEARITGRLEHPGIPPVYAYGQDYSGRPYLAMRLVRGHTWSSLLKARTDEARAPGAGLDLRAHLGILRRVCDAVAFAHSRGIVHRDLKPDNVMLGAFGEVLVLDWGIALDLAAPAGVPSIFDSGRPVGTPSYMAPELAAGCEADVGPATDVYLLGGILYELLTGTPPHRGDTAADKVEAAGAGDIEPPAQRAPDRRIDAGLAEIALRALEREPWRRYATPLELARALDEHERRESAVALADTGSAEADAARAAASGGTARPAEVYGRFGAAVTALSEALARWPERRATARRLNDTRADLACYAVGAGDLALAETEVARIPSHDPAAARAREAISAAHGRRRAASRRRRIIAAVVACVLALAAWAGLRERERRAVLDSARQRRARAELELASGAAWGEYPVKVAAARRAIELDPTWPGAWAELGRIHYRDNVGATLSRDVDARVVRSAYADAAQCFEQAMQLGANDPQLLNEAGYCWTSLGQWGRARPLYERCVAQDPASVHAIDAAGVLALADGRFADAAAHFERCVALEPQGFFRFERGVALVALGRLDAALEDADAALAGDRGAECYAFLAALVRLARNDQRGTAVSLLATLPDNDDSPHLLALLAVHAARLGDAPRARAAFEAAQRARARFGGACGDEPWFACIARASGEVALLGRAVLLLDSPELLLASEPAASVRERQLAHAALDRGDARGALAHASLALADDPVDGAAYLVRGRALVALGRADAAADDLRRAVLLAFGDPAAAVALTDATQATGSDAGSGSARGSR